MNSHDWDKPPTNWRSISSMHSTVNPGLITPWMINRGGVPFSWGFITFGGNNPLIMGRVYKSWDNIGTSKNLSFLPFTANFVFACLHPMRLTVQDSPERPICAVLENGQKKPQHPNPAPQVSYGRVSFVEDPVVDILLHPFPLASALRVKKSQGKDQQVSCGFPDPHGTPFLSEPHLSYMGVSF